MRVHELIEALRKLDRNAYVVVNDTIVADVLEITGRAGDGQRHWPDSFRRVDGGKDKAVTFMRHTEFSDGSIGLSSIFSQ